MYDVSEEVNDIFRLWEIDQKNCGYVLLNLKLVTYAFRA